MTSITRTRLRCNEKDCPRRDDEDFHKPVCRAIPNVAHSDEAQHQHWPKRSQGGKTVVAVICSYCHFKIDSGPWGNAVEFGVYRIWDAHGNTLLRVSSAAAEDVQAGEASSAVAPGASSMAGEQSATAQAEGNAPQEGSPATPGVPASEPSLGGDGVNAPPAKGPSPPSLDAWCQRGMGLLFACKRMEAMSVTLAFEVGDWVNEGEGRFGEEASQFIDQFSYWKVNKWASIARRIPPENRVFGNVAKITVDHFRAVANLAPPEQHRALEEAAIKEESAASLRRRLEPESVEQFETCTCSCGNVHKRKE